jgi:hypothetical protein
MAASDGGYAAPLLSRKIVVLALTPGQHFTHEQAPTAVPDRIWDEVLIEHKDQFEKWTKIEELDF